jgi:hypothetical protein
VRHSWKSSKGTHEGDTGPDEALPATMRMGLSLNEAKTSLRNARVERFDFLL